MQNKLAGLEKINARGLVPFLKDKNLIARKWVYKVESKVRHFPRVPAKAAKRG